MHYLALFYVCSTKHRNKMHLFLCFTNFVYSEKVKELLNKLLLLSTGVLHLFVPRNSVYFHMNSNFIFLCILEIVLQYKRLCVYTCPHSKPVLNLQNRLPQ